MMNWALFRTNLDRVLDIIDALDEEGGGKGWLWNLLSAGLTAAAFIALQKNKWTCSINCINSITISSSWI